MSARSVATAAALAAIALLPVLVSGSARAAGPGAPAPDQLVSEFEEQVRRYEAAARAFRNDVRRIVDQNYDRRRETIQQGYQSELDQLEEQERARRLDAIAKFEEFLRRYPDHPVYTPDAMFRLAELYFERSNDDYLLALERHEDALSEFEDGTLRTRPQEPVQEYGDTVRLFQGLIGRFPAYRHIGGAYYLLGYCYSETGREEEGYQLLTELVRKKPNSRFVAEAWMRIGEYHFDRNQLKPASDAYAKALNYPDSPYFDRALYKLAWTYYRMDSFSNAIARFKELVEYADDKAGTDDGSDLRVEAIQYLAVSLAEEDWDGDGLADSEPPVDRTFRFLTGKKPYEVEVLRKLGDIFFDNTRYDDSLRIYRYLLERFPLDPHNPEVHGKVVVCLERLQRLDEAYAERGAMTANYEDGSDWHRHNQDNRKALRAARESSETALYTSAVYHHERAQSLKDEARLKGDAQILEQSKKHYEVAAQAYAEYLRRHPHSKNAYELNFYYADCLYFSFKFPEAAAQYLRVRDAAADGKYREEAAYAAVQAYEHWIEELVTAGALPRRASPTYVPTEEELAAQKGAPEREALPEQVALLVSGRDEYVAAGLVNKADALVPGRFAFKAAEVFYRFGHLEEARKRFQAIIAERPKEEVASLAAQYIIESYRLAEDWQKMAEWSERVAALDLGTPEERRKLREEVTTLKVGALFRSAEELFQEEQYAKAAEAYVALVNENPQNKYADRALNNAAVAYEQLGKFESAMKLYERIYRDYPDRPFAENALYRVAVSSERFFAWRKAVESYLLLVDKFPDSERRAEALITAAALQENLQDYEAAAGTYLRYVREYPERPDAPVSLYQVGLVYEKKRDYREMSKTFERFIKRFGGDPSNNERVLDALAKMAERRDAEGKWREASRLYARILREFAARGMAPGTPMAAHAAKAQFMLAEHEFKAYEATPIAGSVAQQGRAIKRLQTMSRQLSVQFSEVFDFKNLTWTLAAYYRLACLFQRFAEKLYKAPIPKAIARDEDAAAMYRMQLEDVAVPIEDEAVQRFEKALAVARENRIVNEWTRRILEVLNKYKPSTYPLLKQERREMVEEPVYGLPPSAAPPDAPEPSPAAPAPAAPSAPEAPGPAAPAAGGAPPEAPAGAGGVQ